MRAREYDPSTGQFLSVDPFAAVTGAPYNYAADDPVNNVDPTGLSRTRLKSSAKAACRVSGRCAVLRRRPKKRYAALSKQSNTALKKRSTRSPETKAPTTKAKQSSSRKKPNERTAETRPSRLDPAGNGEAKGQSVVMKAHGTTLTRGKACIQIWATQSTVPIHDYTGPDKSQWRLYPDGRIEPKE